MSSDLEGRAKGQAAAFFEAVRQPNQVARTLSSSMQPLILMGEYNRAFAAAERARKIFNTEGDSWRLARLDINLGNVYFRQDRFGEALASYERAYQGLQPQRDSVAFARRRVEISLRVGSAMPRLRRTHECLQYRGLQYRGGQYRDGQYRGRAALSAPRKAPQISAGFSPRGRVLCRLRVSAPSCSRAVQCIKFGLRQCFTVDPDPLT